MQTLNCVLVKCTGAWFLGACQSQKVRENTNKHSCHINFILVLSREEICAILEENTPSASQFAASNVAGCWRRNPKVAEYTLIHRPTSGTPIVLLDPVLSELYEDIIDKKYAPTPEDCRAAKSLIDRLSIGFDNEANMQQSVDKWAADYGIVM